MPFAQISSNFQKKQNESDPKEKKSKDQTEKKRREKDVISQKSFSFEFRFTKGYNHEI